METSQKVKKKSRIKEIAHRFVQRKMAVVGVVIFCFLLLMALFAPLIAPYGEDEQDLSNTLAPMSAEHLFGTDVVGRDLFSRIVLGSRVSLFVGVISVSIALLVGGSLGAIAGFYGGKVDNLIMRFFDVTHAVPTMILAMCICAALGQGLFNTMLAVGIASCPGYARMVRASVMSAKAQEFVEAARANGASDFRIIIKHILPNCLAPIIVQVSMGVAGAILSAASMSFIGLGIQPPAAEWGALLSGSRAFIFNRPNLVFFPGLFIMLTIFSLNLIGDGLRDALDPKLKR